MMTVRNVAKRTNRYYVFLKMYTSGWEGSTEATNLLYVLTGMTLVDNPCQCDIDQCYCARKFRNSLLRGRANIPLGQDRIGRYPSHWCGQQAYSSHGSMLETEAVQTSEQCPTACLDVVCAGD